MTSKDPVANLGRTLTDAAAAAERRFDDADRIMGGRSPARRDANAVRATFSFPPDDHALLADLQARCLAASFQASKSELVRAGLHALAALPQDALRETIDALTKYQPGRSRWTAPDTPAPRS